MPRSTNAPASRKRRNNRLKKARGFRGGRSKLFRTATESVDRAECMATAHRRTRKRDFRRLWIARISAAVKPFDMNYSTFINGLNKAGVDLNRKMLSEIAIHDPKGFENIVDQAKAALN
ncbi:MAG: 50S ribosomal protein L20 [Kiritimatiellia bacterium]